MPVLPTSLQPGAVGARYSKPTIDAMIMDSIFNSRPDLKRKFETIDRNISHTASININQMKADEILGHHREQTNGSVANFKLRMPALSSESNSVDSFSHDVNEILLQQQQRI